MDCFSSGNSKVKRIDFFCDSNADITIENLIISGCDYKEEFFLFRSIIEIGQCKRKKDRFRITMRNFGFVNNANGEDAAMIASKDPDCYEFVLEDSAYVSNVDYGTSSLSGTNYITHLRVESNHYTKGNEYIQPIFESPLSTSHTFVTELNAVRNRMIFLDTYTDSIVEISNSTIESNTVLDNEGFISGMFPIVRVRDSTFSNNRGSVLALESGELCHFIEIR